MSTIKTVVTDANVEDFLRTVENETRRADGLKLLELFRETTGQNPKMWGASIVGFGSYHYKSERSKQEGDWPLVGFSPRKTNLTLYIIGGFDGQEDLLAQLGKHKTSVGCLYINKLADVDLVILAQIIRRAYDEMLRAHPA
jgi:hypothetical protein